MAKATTPAHEGIPGRVAHQCKQRNRIACLRAFKVRFVSSIAELSQSMFECSRVDLSPGQVLAQVKKGPPPLGPGSLG